MELFDITLVGVNVETGQKLLLTVAFTAVVLLLRAAVIRVASLVTGRHRNDVPPLRVDTR